MSYYPESESHITDKVKDLLDLLSYATKKENILQVLIHLIHLPKRIFFALKAKVDKLHNVPTSLNNAKIKIYDLNVTKLKTVPIDL